jgi:hypothetical protein
MRVGVWRPSPATRRRRSCRKKLRADIPAHSDRIRETSGYGSTSFKFFKHILRPIISLDLLDITGGDPLFRLRSCSLAPRPRADPPAPQALARWSWRQAQATSLPGFTFLRQ